MAKSEAYLQEAMSRYSLTCTNFRCVQPLRMRRSIGASMP